MVVEVAGGAGANQRAQQEKEGDIGPTVLFENEKVKIIKHVIRPGERNELKERGDNRVAPRRLLELGKLLNVPVTYFLEGALPGVDAASERSRDGALLDDPRTLQLVRYYHRIDDPDLRQRVFLLIKSAGSVDWGKPKRPRGREAASGRRGKGAALQK